MSKSCWSQHWTSITENRRRKSISHSESISEMENVIGCAEILQVQLRLEHRSILDTPSPFQTEAPLLADKQPFSLHLTSLPSPCPQLLLRWHRDEKQTENKLDNKQKHHLQQLYVQKTNKQINSKIVRLIRREGKRNEENEYITSKQCLEKNWNSSEKPWNGSFEKGIHQKDENRWWIEKTEAC